MSIIQQERERVSRRRMIQTLALGAVSGVASAEGTKNSSLRIDCHLHCFAGRKSEKFPYHRNAPYRPVDVASPEHLLSCMVGAGVSNAVVVHPEPYQDDHRYLRHCLEIGEGKLKGTCLYFATDPNASSKMRQLASSSSLVAARIHAYAPDRLPPFGSAELRELWASIAGLGLAVQLHFEPRYAHHFDALIREFKDTTVVIDHLGRPFQGTNEEHETVLRWGQYPNTIIKLSAIPEQRQYPHRNIRPVIRRLVSEFGVGKMIYGGGFGASATPASYRAAFERAIGYLDFLSPVEQEAILGENAKTLFGWG